MGTVLLLALSTNLASHPVPKNTLSKAELNCLALAIYHEARGEPLLGQKAVAYTVLNRVKSGKFPNSICGVIYQPGQFTDIRKTKVRDRKLWLRVNNIAHKAITKPYKFNALYFHAGSVQPGWKRKYIAKIGNHHFYS